MSAPSIQRRDPTANDVQAKQARQLQRLLAANRRLRRENDVCVDQLFLHRVPIEGVEGEVRRAMERRMAGSKSTGERLTTDRTTFYSGFESTDDEEEETEEGEKDEEGEHGDTADDSSSQASMSISECPSRAEGQEADTSDLNLPDEAAMISTSTAPPFDALIESLTTPHASMHDIHHHLAHITALLTLHATQPAQPASPTLSPPSTAECSANSSHSGGDFNRTGGSGGSDGSALFERSTELQAVMEMRVQLQHERAKRGRRLVSQLRQLVQCQAAEIAAMRGELDVLREAAHDTHAICLARDALQMQELMATLASRPTSSASSRRPSTAADGQVGGLSATACVSDVQQVCGLLDGVMRHVHDSGVRSQSYVEDVKRLCDEQSRRASCVLSTA